MLTISSLNEPFGTKNFLGFIDTSAVRVMDGTFVLFWAVQTSHASATMNSGPGIHLWCNVCGHSDIVSFLDLCLFVFVDN